MSDSLIFLYIYRHRETGKAYIGVTKDPARRFRKHAAGNSAAIAFNRAVRKYGIESFDHRILAIFDDVDAANYHENAAIAAFRTLSPNGYNLVGGAPRSEYFGCHSQETKDKIGASQKGKIIPAEQIEKLKIIMGSRGVREKISRANKGRLPSEKTKEALIKALKGKPLSAEHRAKIKAGLNKPEVLARISETSSSRIASPETRRKMSESHKGKVRSKEHCDNLSKAMTGKKLPSEVKEKISKAHKGKPWSQARREAQLQTREAREKTDV